MTVNYWTTKEIEILRHMAASPVPTTKNLHLLPGRTLGSVCKAMMRMKLKKGRWTREIAFEAALRALKSRDMSSAVLAESLGISRQWMIQIVRHLHKSKQIHIHDRVLITGSRSNRTRIWRYGAGIDMPPKTQNRNIRLKKKESEERKPTQVEVRRDPFDVFFFGKVAA
jgi:hypothetical protein